MVPVRKPPTIDDRKLATLRFCEQELLRRRDQDLADAWYWGIKGKVARFCIRLEERKLELPPDAPVVELSGEEQTETRQTHSLLGERPAAGQAMRITDADWLGTIRRKVERYVHGFQPREEAPE